ncbi:hypothetical protein BpHYR1_038143 [Brachionus plicatilis]|uniref:Uncharacterized protein n=1 Tax=Brachionus plicatilis TaxID=10195 RepID=A0A3M7QAH5_BRAPC|nr:hypothetical protein BpHYR1_038143 [Brachionus plicatilis]
MHSKILDANELNLIVSINVNKVIANFSRVNLLVLISVMEAIRSKPVIRLFDNPISWKKDIKILRKKST